MPRESEWRHVDVVTRTGNTSKDLTTTERNHHYEIYTSTIMVDILAGHVGLAEHICLQESFPKFILKASCSWSLARAWKEAAKDGT